MDSKIYANDAPKGDIQQIFQFDDENISGWFNDPFTFNSIILRDQQDNIIGGGVLRVVNEFKIILDPKIADYEKAKAIDISMKEALKKAQCNEIILSTTKGGWKFRQLLIQHYGFYIDPGILLRLER